MSTLTFPTEPNARARFYATALRNSEPRITTTRGLDGYYSLTFKWHDPNGSARATIFGVHADVIAIILGDHNKLSKTKVETQVSITKGSEAAI